jgi:hypothetical protein
VDGVKRSRNHALTASAGYRVANQSDPSCRPASPSPRELPVWSEGKPAAPGVFIGFSVLPERRWETPSLYTFDGETFQHWTGWYDHGVTHWMPTDLPFEPAADTQTGAVDGSPDDLATATAYGTGDYFTPGIIT